MKRVELLLLALFAFSTLAAQNYQLVVISSERVSPRKDSMMMAETSRHFLSVHEQGFQQSAPPNFVITGNNNRFMFGIGGYVNFRTAYDLDGALPNLDFVTYDITVPNSWQERQRLFMDASTTRLYFRTLIKSRCLGLITTYVETDFRGYHGDLRMRQAYVAFKGLLFGRSATTFCDLGAGPNTVDFQGPNAYNFKFNNMIRYRYAISPNWTIAAALEMPSVSGTYSDELQAIPQRVPDLPLYVQWNWGYRTGLMSHLRASAVFRDMFYYNVSSDKHQETFGWGVQLSGNIKIFRPLQIFMNGVYGKGITPYIQDLYGSGLDLVPKDNGAQHLQALPMMGWQAALQYNITPRCFVSGGYSQVRVYDEYGFKPDDVYRFGQYIFGNVFYHVTPSCKVAVEYLYGERQNMNDVKGHSNRIQAMIQYNF